MFQINKNKLFKVNLRSLGNSFTNNSVISLFCHEVVSTTSIKNQLLMYFITLSTVDASHIYTYAYVPSSEL